MDSIELTLYNEKTSEIQQVTVINFDELSDLIQVYFHIEKNNQIIKFNNNELNIKKSLLEYGLVNNDILIVLEHNTRQSNQHSNQHSNQQSNQQNMNDEIGDIMDDMLMYSSISYTMIYLKGEYNNIAFKLMVDSGAQISVISNYMANYLGISHLIDTRMKGEAKGVGTSNILGGIYNCHIKVDGYIHMPINFRVMDNDFDKHLILLGLDFLNSHNCIVNFQNRTIQINNNVIKFMNEGEVNNYVLPFNIKKLNISKKFDEMTSKIAIDHKISVINLLKKIVTNIINNPHNNKFKSLNPENSVFKEILGDKECIDFIKSIGFEKTLDGKYTFTNDLDMLNFTNEIICA